MKAPPGGCGALRAYGMMLSSPGAVPDVGDIAVAGSRDAPL